MSNEQARRLASMLTEKQKTQLLQLLDILTAERAERELTSK